MNDRDGSPRARLERSWNGIHDGDGDSEKSTWKRVGSLLQLVVVVAAAFGGVVVSTASTAFDRTSRLVQTGGPALFDALWPVLLGVTALAVVACVVVVVLGVRNA